MFRCSFVFLLALLSLTCRPSGSGLPHGVNWMRPAYSRLFMLGTLGKDSFLAMRNPDDTAQWLQVIHWGGSASYNGTLHLDRRKTVVAMSAVFTGMMEALGCEAMLTGMDNHHFATTLGIRRHAARNGIKDLSPTGQLNREALLKLAPDLVLAYYIDSKGKDQWNQMQKAGVKVVFCQNFLEEHPLGRAEWIRAFGWLLGKPADGEAFFSMVAEHYESTREATAERLKEGPTVFCNAPFNGVWDLPAGGSYMSRLISDAGGKYLWASKKGAGRFTLDIEQVFTEAGQADIWLNPGICRELKCLRDMDRRMGLFRAVKEGDVYNSTALNTREGGNAWWDYAVVRPDLALQDLAFIFHPDLFPEHHSVFFERLK